MRVHVDQTGNAGERSQIDDLRAGRDRLGTGSHARYVLTVDDDDSIVHDAPGAVDETREPNCRALRRSGVLHARQENDGAKDHA
jgi:hypothetical protein